MTDYDGDVIVIGAGLGGGVMARALTEAGLQVILLEKGPAGHRREETRLDETLHDRTARVLRSYWPDPADVTIDGRHSRMFLPIGAGIGGSSVFYAATLERPARHDIEDLPDRPHPTGGWPLSWADLAPYFDKAQAQFHIHGTPDPLDDRPAPALLPPAAALPAGEAALMAHLRGNGLHPYHLHAALAGLEGCRACLGRKCPRACKMDGRSAGVEPALATGRLRLETSAEVTAIALDGGMAGRVTYQQGGAAHMLRARHVVLAAGALSSPRLLLASRGAGYEAGIGNAHDQIGRNLMFHLNELFALWPKRSEAFGGASKSLGFRDLYHVGGQRYGMVQALGVEVGYYTILHVIRSRLAEMGLRGRLWREAARLPAIAAARLVGDAKLFVGLMEDLPDPANRIRLDPEDPARICLDYTTAPEAMARRKRFRRLIATACKGRRVMFLSDRPEPNLGHGCGTLRMGHDPQSSATDSAGRIHGIANLWVADAATFPSSMGVNPSLTIAALALRQAEAIIATVQGQGGGAVAKPEENL